MRDMIFNNFGLMSSLRAVFFSVAAVAVVLAGCAKPPSQAQDPVAAANAFFAALEQGDPRTAYNNSAFGFQAAQTFDAFLSNARELGLVGGQPPAWTSKEINASEARLDGAVVSQAGQPINISVTLTPDGNAWRLFSLKTGTPDGDTENRFTLVGKGSGFNDVYHQPMPDPPRLAALVQETLSKFNTAIKTGNFHEFYGYISQQWRDGKRMTGEDASGVTEKMLTDHFQGFTDKKIDLAVVRGLPVVFDKPPLIDQDGLLELYGHIDTVEYRVIFDLQYAYELPRWKLFGINISLTK
jgi:hypothetical protein